MATLFLILTVILISQNKIQAQLIRSPLGFFNRPITEAVIEPRNYIEPSRIYEPRYIEVPLEPPRNFVNIPKIIDPPCNVPNVNVAPTAIVSDCTPSVCKNLANTINLMIVCNLLKNTKGSDEIALQFAAPLLREIIANPAGAISSTTTVSSLLNTDAIVSNLIAPNFIAPNAIAPNYVASNFVAPNATPCNNNAYIISYLLKALSGL